MSGIAVSRSRPILNEVPEHMAQESRADRRCRCKRTFLNEVPEHMAQEWQTIGHAGHEIIHPQ